MRKPNPLAWGLMALTLGPVSLAAGQQPEQQDPISALQTKNILTDEDLASLRSWLKTQLDAIQGVAPAPPKHPAKNLREGYKGTEAFKQAYASACVEEIGTRYKQAERNSAAQLIALLNTLDTPAANRVLIEALQDQRVPVRTAAAIGLRNLRTRLAKAGGNALTDSVNALSQAGKQETSPVALKQIYQAMDYTHLNTPPDPKSIGSALLDLLETRAKQYAADNVKAPAADRPGLEAARALSAQWDEAGRKRLVAAVAEMLRYAVDHYIEQQLYAIENNTSSPVRIELRNRFELFIEAAEGLLSKLTDPPQPPSLTKEMQEKAESKVTDMKNKYKQWADLLQQRFQIDVQLTGGEGGESPVESSIRKPAAP